MGTLPTRISTAALGAFLACVLFASEARAQVPINDNCASATFVGIGTFTGNMSAATNDGVASCDSGGSASRDVWFFFTSTTNGIISIDTCGSTCDTVLTVYNSCGGAELLCNDDCGGLPCGATASCISGIGVTAGLSLVIRISDKGLGCGNYTLNIITGTPGVVSAGSDMLHTPDGGCSYKDFSGVPIPTNFFGSNSNAFSGAMFFKGAPLVGTGIPPGTDTIIERLAAANLVACPSTSAPIPLAVRALGLQSAIDINVFFPVPAGSFATYRIDLCLSTSFAQPATSTMTIMRLNLAGGEFTSTLNIRPKFTFTRTGGGGPNPTLGVLGATLDTGSIITLNSPGIGTPPTTWVFSGPAPTSPGGVVDHDCNGVATIAFAPSTNFVVGFVAPGATCGNPGGRLVKQLSAEGAILARHCFLPVYMAPVEGPYCMCQGNFTPQPCNNSGGLGRGCENSGTTGGGLLAVSGVSDVSSDTVTLMGNTLPFTANLYLQGTGAVTGPFGDGLLCVGGAFIRLGIKFSAFDGSSAFPSGSDPLLSIAGVVPLAGGQRFYQIWYRDSSATFCPTATFNLSNAYQLVWVP